MAQPESDFLHNKIGVRQFIKELGHDSVYLDSVYYVSSNPKFIETCIKHFLERSLSGASEMRFYTDILVKPGVCTLVDTILDSEAYRKFFDCFTVPYSREYRSYQSPKAYLATAIVRYDSGGEGGRCPRGTGINLE